MTDGPSHLPDRRPDVDFASEGSAVWNGAKAGLSGLVAIVYLGLGVPRCAHAPGRLWLLHLALGLYAAVGAGWSGWHARRYYLAAHGRRPRPDDSESLRKAWGFMLDFLGVRLVLAAGAMVIIVDALAGGR